MIRDAIEKIESLVESTFEFEMQEINGHSYYIDRGGKPVRMLADGEATPPTINFNTLTGLVDYINTNIDSHSMEKCAVHINNPLSVSLITSIFPTLDNERFTLAEVKCNAINYHFGDPKWFGDPWYPLINFVIALQSQFVQGPGVEDIIAMLSNLHNERVTEVKDDNFTQQLQLKTGITSKSNVQVKNPVKLAPFRTFKEITQPEGDFILRFKEGKDKGIVCALFMADGGQWELEAMSNIKYFLDAHINESIPILC